MTERYNYVLFNTNNMKENRRKINFKYICAGNKLVIVYNLKITCIITLYFLIMATYTHSHKIMIF